MGLNDAGEMLEAAKAECLRLEQELAEMDLLLERTRTLFYKAEGERDRARATAVRLEQELAQGDARVLVEEAARIEQGDTPEDRQVGEWLRWRAEQRSGIEQEDALAEARRTKWVCE